MIFAGFASLMQNLYRLDKVDLILFYY